MFIDDSTCYLAMEDTPELAPIRQAIVTALKGFDVRLLPSMPDRGAELIGVAKFVIADLTSATPYVFYQLGMADALRRPTLVITQRPAEIPPELAWHRPLGYRPDQTSTLIEFLGYWIKETLTARTKTLSVG